MTREDVRNQAQSKLPADVDAAQVRERANNVYTDKQGNVYKKDNKQWSQRTSSGNWQSTTRDQSPSIPNMERAAQNRARGATRTQNYQRAAPAARPAGPARAPARRGRN